MNAYDLAAGLVLTATVTAIVLVAVLAGVDRLARAIVRRIH